MELEDDGKVDIIFEQVQNVLQSLKQKIKDGSATNKEYIQAMILVNEATISNSSTLIKDHNSMTQNEQENKTVSLPSTSYEDSFSEDCAVLTSHIAGTQEIFDGRMNELPIGKWIKNMNRHFTKGKIKANKQEFKFKLLLI
uniref:SET domain bifurcated histone lysine methyltransferase 2 n=1 Tax=Rousettus aegyptiacus TaxID=9407 RepID=A0A7J8DZ09_ROUAE|nr:SET domain bifurcated histone lysine methyltransferase 2 [Rousettus aegyptiacus]